LVVTGSLTATFASFDLWEGEEAVEWAARRDSMLQGGELGWTVPEDTAAASL
jgi:hypothetical protein